MNSAVDFLKQSASLAFAIAPYLATRLSILPLLKPQIAVDMEVITMIFAGAAGLVSYNLTHWSKRMATLRAQVTLGLPIVGFLVALASVNLMLMIVMGIGMTFTPALTSLLLHVTFLLLFVGLAVVYGWGLELAWP
jgi:hypothetical protein